MDRMYSEDVAKTKWCPFVRHVDEFGGSFNRGIEPGNAANIGRTNGNYSCACIASGCMAWRNFYEGTKPLEGFGYCGLAGRNIW